MSIVKQALFNGQHGWANNSYGICLLMCGLSHGIESRQELVCKPFFK